MAQVFGQLQVLMTMRRDGRRKALCQCRCGVEKWIRMDSLKEGRTISCGCVNRAKSAARVFKHGRSNSGAYRSWNSMMNRCYRPDNDNYPDYGGRGIRVCHRWHDARNFIADMGERPENHQLDRIDNAGDYCPENCRWVTAKANANNRRNSTFVEFNGKKQTISQWADETGLSYRLIAFRLRRGWTPERALNTQRRTYGFNRSL